MRASATSSEKDPHGSSSVSFRLQRYYNFKSILGEGFLSGEMKIIEEAQGVDVWKRSRPFFQEDE